MKVLLLFPMRDKQTGPAIKYAFNRLGHDVVTVDAKREWNRSHVVAVKYKPDLIFCSRTIVLTDEVAEIKRIMPKVTICMWNVDIKGTPDYIDGWASLFPLIKLIDYYFVVDTGSIPLWKQLNPRTFWLPQGLQEEVYHKPEEISDNDTKKYACDISFAGKDRRFRRPFLNAIDQMGIDFKRWGHKGITKVYNEEHNKMAALSKINLCCSGWVENGCTSVRNYKVMGAGGFVLEYYRKGIFNLFPADAIACYKSPIDLINKIEFWLANDQARKEYAERGHKWVHENATYTHRIKMALEYMKL